ncbi:BAG family molecular chaperone regulator 1-like [Curcuma longa]|uniref:BAG family molecular chaperone regulator 1-like n=1 Tax=Curcuma longa TaxID=136217 RepID=UPI003D9DBBB5
MRTRTGGRVAKTMTAFSPVKEEKVEAEKWEVRPGGMLVQMRNAYGDAVGVPVPTIRVKVKYGAAYHEIYISAQATFGEMKKELSARTGLHPLDMKLMYKEKERASATFLDAVGVKDMSKMLLMEDPMAKAKRLLEMRKTDKIDKAAKSVSAIRLEVDRLASKVTALEEIVNKGERIVVNDVSNLIDCLMNELIKMEAIDADGDVMQQKSLQIKRVQKYVEILDLIKIHNVQLNKEKPLSPPQTLHPSHQRPTQLVQQQQPFLHSIQSQYQQQMQQPRNPFLQQNHHQQHPTLSHSEFWEPFDLLTPPTSTAHASINWELF